MYPSSTRLFKPLDVATAVLEENRQNYN
jgi:hypothetical protein